MISICCFEIRGGNVTVKESFDEPSFRLSDVGHCLRSLLPMLCLPASAAAQSTCSNFGTVSIDGGSYIFQNNEWNSGLEQCATVNGVGFSLTTADFNLGHPSDSGSEVIRQRKMPVLRRKQPSAAKAEFIPQ
jgi:hypothetical protein